MNWIANFVRPRIKGLMRSASSDTLWRKCTGCGEMVFHRDLVAADNVCPQCNHHMRIGAKDRFARLFDDGAHEVLPCPEVPQDPLRFRDDKRYADRLKEYRARTTQPDALVAARGVLDGVPVIIAVQSFEFMGGSLGLATGAALIAAMQTAVAEMRPFILVVSSGGARMQEGLLSLMQMQRANVGVDMLNDAGLPYVVVMTDSTMSWSNPFDANLGNVQ